MPTEGAWRGRLPRQAARTLCPSLLPWRQLAGQATAAGVHTRCPCRPTQGRRRHEPVPSHVRRLRWSCAGGQEAQGPAAPQRLKHGWCAGQATRAGWWLHLQGMVVGCQRRAGRMAGRLAGLHPRWRAGRLSGHARQLRSGAGSARLTGWLRGCILSGNSGRLCTVPHHPAPRTSTRPVLLLTPPCRGAERRGKTLEALQARPRQCLPSHCCWLFMTDSFVGCPCVTIRLGEPWGSGRSARTATGGGSRAHAAGDKRQPSEGAFRPLGALQGYAGAPLSGRRPVAGHWPRGRTQGGGGGGGGERAGVALARHWPLGAQRRDGSDQDPTRHRWADGSCTLSTELTAGLR